MNRRRTLRLLRSALHLLNAKSSAAVLVLLLTSVDTKAATVLHLRFDESGGSLASDSTGSYSGALSATGASFVNGGKSGNALRLDRSSNGYVDLGVVEPVVSTNFSISVWVRVDTDFTGDRAAVLSKHAQNYQNGYFLMVNAAGGFSGPGLVSFYAGPDNPVLISQTTVNDGQWHHVVCVFDSQAGRKIYIDGSPAESAVTTGALIASPARVILGGFDEGGTGRGYFSGLIDELMMFDRALTMRKLTFCCRIPEPLPARAARSRSCLQAGCSPTRCRFCW